MKRETINGRPYTHYNANFGNQPKTNPEWQRVLLKIIYIGAIVALIILSRKH